ncbi:MAG TPA: NAD(P)-dependent alcohol dehydrogenase [Nitrososphaeraceae archaeon]|nr:NAD(P)-dependent alcohol dehydrogenase [Nitrososphaeraceae archaeon]
MISARVMEYQKPLNIENVDKPQVQHGHQVLLRVGSTGLCHSDLHLINGDWKNTIPLQLPIIPGHEIAGWVEEIGDLVPKEFLQKGDLVAVFGGWGCGICIYCKDGNEQLCPYPQWPGIMRNGGFAEYILIDSYRFLVKVEVEEEEEIRQKKNDRSKGELQNKEEVERRETLKIESIAPLTDAGLTPYRAIKNIRNLLGPGKTIGIVGIGGLGYYGVQYAKILGQSADVIAFDRKDEKIDLAKEIGADFTINNSVDFSKLKDEVSAITKGKGIDVIIDCVGAENTVYNSIRLLNKGGTLVVVGLFGNQMTFPLVPSVINEYKIHGSLWGNYNELREVIKLASKGKLKHKINRFALRDINKSINKLQNGEILGRAVIVP